MFIIQTKDDTPVYVQLQHQVLDYIALGILKKDDQLPSVRTLSKELGINPNTVAKAYSNLELHGYVYSIPAKGVFVKSENVTDLVYEQKLEELKTKMRDCKNVGIEKEKILDLVDKVYEEVDEYVEG
ncbi:GntR family transcriptional regulator [uncultured Traorella sp.]|uniref:GntR family transcriptional regulator n=1 Tax=uncultured Traorella sp. TaxID=1929048 RepID=UPI0025D5ABCB|nr:GntR family transcriptional regulator [uncultured Traorella sp.]